MIMIKQAHLMTFAEEKEQNKSTVEPSSAGNPTEENGGTKEQSNTIRYLLTRF